MSPERMNNGCSWLTTCGLLFTSTLGHVDDVTSTDHTLTYIDSATMIHRVTRTDDCWVSDRLPGIPTTAARSGRQVRPTAPSVARSTRCTGRPGRRL